MTSTGFYLLDNQNPNAPVRADGRRFWGYSTRQKAVQVGVLHTAENLPDLVLPDKGAENVANYGATTTRPASWHDLVDSDSIIRCLPRSYTAFHVQGYNSISVGLEIATRAAMWSAVPKHWKLAALQNAAIVGREWHVEFGLPLRRLTKAEVDRGLKGFTDHARLDPKRRSDPGFDAAMWDLFFEFVAATPAPAPAPTPVRFSVVRSYVASLVAPNGGTWHVQADGGIITDDDDAGGPTAPFYGSVPGVGGLPVGVVVKGLLPYLGGYRVLVQHPDGKMTSYHFPAPGGGV